MRNKMYNAKQEACIIKKQTVHRSTAHPPQSTRTGIAKSESRRRSLFRKSNFIITHSDQHS